MNKKVYLFCGVESTGKSTAIENMYTHLTNKGYKVKIVSEVGRDICQESGGVDQMTLTDYERILHLHQTNFLKAYENSEFEIILLDTDSTYTRYYLEKDIPLLSSNKPISKKLINLSEEIAKTNNALNRITKIIYLNPDCPFIQDGTRTYEKTRYEDDKILLSLYKQIYKRNINIIKGKDYTSRTTQIIRAIEKD